MNIYEVKWFDGLNWCDMYLKLMAESESQVLEYMNKNYPYREITKKTFLDYVDIKQDSTKIVEVGTDIKFPYVISDSNE